MDTGLVLCFKQLQVSQATFTFALNCGACRVGGWTSLLPAAPAGSRNQILSRDSASDWDAPMCTHSLFLREPVHVSPSQHLHLSDSFNSCQDSSSRHLAGKCMDKSELLINTHSLINPRILSLPRIPPAMQQCNVSLPSTGTDTPECSKGNFSSVQMTLTEKDGGSQDSLTKLSHLCF